MKRISCGAAGLPNLPKSPIKMNIAKSKLPDSTGQNSGYSNRVMIVGLSGHGKAKSQLGMALKGPPGSRARTWRLLKSAIYNCKLSLVVMKKCNISAMLLPITDQRASETSEAHREN
jgi:hypothetical protein